MGSDGGTVRRSPRRSRTFVADRQRGDPHRQWTTCAASVTNRCACVHHAVLHRTVLLRVRVQVVGTCPTCRGSLQPHAARADGRACAPRPPDKRSNAIELVVIAHLDPTACPDLLRERGECSSADVRPNAKRHPVGPYQGPRAIKNSVARFRDG
jgi:hypothetical protein